MEKSKDNGKGCGHGLSGPGLLLLLHVLTTLRPAAQRTVRASAKGAGVSIPGLAAGAAVSIPVARRVAAVAATNAIKELPSVITRTRLLSHRQCTYCHL